MTRQRNTREVQGTIRIDIIDVLIKPGDHRIQQGLFIIDIVGIGGNGRKRRVRRIAVQYVTFGDVVVSRDWADDPMTILAFAGVRVILFKGQDHCLCRVTIYILESVIHGVIRYTSRKRLTNPLTWCIIGVCYLNLEFPGGIELLLRVRSGRVTVIDRHRQVVGVGVIRNGTLATRRPLEVRHPILKIVFKCK